MVYNCINIASEYIMEDRTDMYETEVKMQMGCIDVWTSKTQSAANRNHQISQVLSRIWPTHSGHGSEMGHQWTHRICSVLLIMKISQPMPPIFGGKYVEICWGKRYILEHTYTYTGKQKNIMVPGIWHYLGQAFHLSQTSVACGQNTNYTYITIPTTLGTS